MHWVCSSCGFHCSDSLGSCPDCGAPWKAGSVVVAEEATTQPQPEKPSGHRSGKGKK